MSTDFIIFCCSVCSMRSFTNWFWFVFFFDFFFIIEKSVCCCCCCCRFFAFEQLEKVTDFTIQMFAVLFTFHGISQQLSIGFPSFWFYLISTINQQTKQQQKFMDKIICRKKNLRAQRVIKMCVCVVVVAVLCVCLVGFCMISWRRVKFYFWQFSHF